MVNEVIKVSLVIDRNTPVYFDSFRIEFILQEVLSKIKLKSITNNIFRIQPDDSIMVEFYCIAFIEYMLGFIPTYFLWMTIKRMTR